MKNRSTREHITPEELAAYFATTLSEDREGEIEEHLAECSACTEQAREIYTLQARQLQAFTWLWEQWTARTHGEAYRRARLGRALQQAQVQVANQAWQERLARWREQWSGKAEAAARVIMEASGRVSQIITEGLEALVRPEGAWEFTPAPGTIRTRGSGRGAVRTRGKVALTSGKPQAQITVSEETGVVEIRVDELPPGQTPLVVLIPMQEGDEPQVQELKRSLQGRSVSARFENVAPGDYLLTLEPLAPAGP